MANKRKMEVVIAGDNKQLNRTLDKTEGKLGTFGSKFKSFAGGIAAGMATAFAADKLIGWGASFFTLGQQLEVFDKKVETVFEGQADAIRVWADENNEALGLTNEQLAGLAANFGDLLKPMGFTANQAAAMSQEVLGLAGALSAWSGGTRSAQEMSEILAKAMLGEREQLKELGISITEFDVQARLAAKRQKELTGAALEQAKAIATQELIFEKSTDAQAAWNDGSMANIQSANELKASFGELQEEIANRLQPVFQGFINFATDEFLPFWETVAAAWDAGGLDGVLAVLGAWWDGSARPWFEEKGREALAALADGMGVDPERFQSGLDRLLGNWDGFWERFGDGQNEARTSWDAFTEDLGGVGDLFAGFFDFHSWDTLVDKIESAGAKFQEFFDFTSPQEALDKFLDGWGDLDSMLDPIGDFFAEALGQAADLLEAITGLYDALRGLGEEVSKIPIIGDAIDFFGFDDGTAVLGPFAPLVDLLPGFAGGGRPSDGYSLVGESGPELLNKRGSQLEVIPLGGGSMSGVGTTLNFYGYTDDALVENVRRANAEDAWRNVSGRAGG